MEDRKIILTFAGPPASGKGTCCEYFVKKYNAVHLRFSQPTRDILDIIHLPRTRDNMQKLSLVLRRNFGADIFSKILAAQAQEAASKLVVIDGARRLADVDHLKAISGFHLVAVDAPAKLRYERLIARRENPDDAMKTWDEFLKQEQADAEVLIPEIMAQAESRIINGGSMRELQRKLDEIYRNVSDAG